MAEPRRPIILAITRLAGVFRAAAIRMTTPIAAIYYWQLSSLTSAYLVSGIVGPAYMTGTLIQLDLTARIIPASVMMAMSCWLMVPALRRVAPQWWDELS
jgi:fucose permease